MEHLSNGSELQGGKYRIISVLGQGGFGITYLAENTFFEKKVAIKEFFPKDFCGRDNTSHVTLGTQNNAETVARLMARFLKEAKNIAKLDHPGIVKIHDIFEENDTAYYVMDYIEGENLNEIVKRQGPLTEEKAVGYICKVGEALEYIHSRQMTHFDVKPANIMIRRDDDRPILIDFGLSKQFDNHGDPTTTLMQGVSNGYSPIELYNPGAITSFSPQTDVYSLAATLYYLLTGTVPPSAPNIFENNAYSSAIHSHALRIAIIAGMNVSQSKRPISIAAFINLLSSEDNNRKKHSFTTILLSVVALIIVISIIIYAKSGPGSNLLADNNNSASIDNRPNASMSASDKQQAIVGDYVYDDNTFSHNKIQGKRVIGRIISAGYQPQVFSFIPIKECTNNEISEAISYFSRDHSNVRIPSLSDYERLAKEIYHYSVEKEYDKTCVSLFRGEHSYTYLKFYIRDENDNYKHFKHLMQPDGMPSGLAWCAEHGEVRSQSSDDKFYRLTIYPEIGVYQCSHSSSFRANLLVIYDL